MCNELSDMQATPLIRGSKKGGKNFLEINFTGSRIFPEYSTESTQSTAQILSHTNRTGCPHFLLLPPYSTPQDICQWPGKGAECYWGQKTRPRGPLNIRRAAGQETSKFTAFWSAVKRGESFIQTQMFCGREAFSQCGETGMVVWANEAGPGWQTAAASSAGDFRPCAQGSLWAAAAPCRERTRQALEHSRHPLWLGACWQVMESWTTPQMIKGPQGVIYEAR